MLNIHNLNSIMILLIREEAMMSVTDTKSFKFHYDSINSFLKWFQEVYPERI